MELQERKQKLLHDAFYCRNLTFTLTKMTQYYGQNYSDALAKAQKGEAYAYCQLGKMFEESVYHSKEHRDYDYPPLGYQEAAKIYYELAALSEYPRGAYYLGKIYLSEEDYPQAEKWMLHAAKHHITDSYYALGNIYHALWKQEKKEIYLEKACAWKQKALTENDNAFIWENIADFYKDILINGQISDLSQRQGLLSEMKAYYQKAVRKHALGSRRSVCEELVSIYLGDYGTAPEIEKAVQYGEDAMRERSAYAAFRIGKYYVENNPEQYNRIVYYLECAMDYPGSVDGAKELFKQYLNEYKVPQYLYTEASLLMEAGSFYNLGRIYHSGSVVEKNMRTALYYYTRSQGELWNMYRKNSASCYNLAYYFMLELQEEGIIIPAAAWEEMESDRSKEKFHPGFDEDVAGILADLNVRYHIMDMQGYQKQIQDIELTFGIPEDKLCDLQSDFYKRGLMDRKDQKYLQEYVTNIILRLEEADTGSQVMTLYQDLIALSDYAADCTAAAGSVPWRMKDRVRRKIADAYLDRMLKVFLIEKITKCSGQPEKNYRVQCHDNYMHNWPEACKKLKDIYKDFLEWSEVDENDE